MEMKPVVVAPGAYASPDPDTEGHRLLPLDETPMSDVISGDYGAVGVTPEGEVVQEEAAESADEEAAEGDPENMTVAELDEAYGHLDGYPESGNKAAKVEFAQSVEG